jgi:ferredoxin-NADP reductase
MSPAEPVHGPLTITLLQALLPIDINRGDAEFFLCGPPGFMQAIYDDLRDLGVCDVRIQPEAFGPSSVQRRPRFGRTRCVHNVERTTWRPAEGKLLLCCAMPVLERGDRVELDL